MSTFYDELETIINRYSIENDSNTPDFILATYLHDCLGAFNNAMIKRDKWYGEDRTDLPKGGTAIALTQQEDI
jgi:hypothetical protein